MLASVLGKINDLLKKAGSPPHKSMARGSFTLPQVKPAWKAFGCLGGLPRSWTYSEGRSYSPVSPVTNELATVKM